MLSIFASILFLVAVVEITSRVNSPADGCGALDSYKFHPEWGHIHYCDGKC